MNARQAFKSEYHRIRVSGELPIPENFSARTGERAGRLAATVARLEWIRATDPVRYLEYRDGWFGLPRRKHHEAYIISASSGHNASFHYDAYKEIKQTYDR